MNPSPTQLPSPVPPFVQLLSPTRHGARRARLLAVAQLRAWSVPAAVVERAELIVAELAANAALHGRVRGRGFRLGLRVDTRAGTLRIEVSDPRGEQLPVVRQGVTSQDACGRGLLLVAALADRWGTAPYAPSGKTVWAQCTWRTS